MKWIAEDLLSTGKNIERERPASKRAKREEKRISFPSEEKDFQGETV